jgi:glutamate synthase domain-containing protein 1
MAVLHLVQGADELERALYLRRRHTARRLVDEGLDWHEDMYFCSCSTRTVVYKGMTNAAALGKFYTDLENEDYASNFCVYHRRFSTNTMPRWPLAQVRSDAPTVTRQLCFWRLVLCTACFVQHFASSMD